MLKDVAFYQRQFSRLRCNVTKERGLAPHKPIMLLTVIKAYEFGWIRDNRIMLSAELVQLFKLIWKKLATSNHNPNFLYPFYHLNSSPFWKLIPKIPDNPQIRNYRAMTKSYGTMDSILLWVEIDLELSSLLQQVGARCILEEYLLNSYFAETKQNYVCLKQSDIEETEICTLQLPETVVDSLQIIDEISFIRGGLFKKIIPQIYNNTCAVSRSRFTSTIAGVSMVDACHIVPFSESHDDSFGNGIALCPNLHRAFDRGLISITDDYKVLVSKNLIEDTSSPYNLSQFNGQKIFLPYSEKLYPSQDNLAWHRNKFGF